MSSNNYRVQHGGCWHIGVVEEKLTTNHSKRYPLPGHLPPNSLPHCTCISGCSRVPVIVMGT
jgi:hypothetical protein